MANWCYNIVQFQAEAGTMEQLENLFSQMAEKETETNHGQLPEFIKEETDWLFNIRWEEQTLYYETRWSPNITTIKKIADHYKAGFLFCYEESGNGIYGECTYKNGILTDTCLDAGDYNQFDYGEEREQYLFEGEWYESDYEILETLLERKKLTTLIKNRKQN